MLWGKVNMLSLFLCVFAQLGAAVPSVAANQRALVEQALDEPTKISLENVKLSDVLGEIGQRTGVRIAIPPDVLALIPHGTETLIREVRIANVPLRQGLTELFSPLGMTFEVRDDGIEIVPKEALLCLGRPPTWAELDTLAELSRTQIGADDLALRKLRSRIQFQIPEPGAWETLAAVIRNVGAGPGDEVLATACANLGWAWCLSGERIVVTSMQQQVRRQLEQRVSLRINNRALFDVLQAVGRRINVSVHSEPGALASLPIQVQHNYSVNVHHWTVEQVFEAICADTGLGYLIEPDGVLFYRPGGRAASEPATVPPTTSVSLSDPYVAKMVVQLEDGKTVEWLIRQSELPEDLRQMRERDLAELFEALRQRQVDDQR